MKQKLLLICQHFYPEMVSTGLHMTELATAINNNYNDIEIEVLCSYPSKNIFKDYEISNEYKNVRIIRKRSYGKEHGPVLSRLFFSTSFFIKVFVHLLFHHKQYRGFIITTNPPFLGLATVFIKKLFGKPYFLIVYDVYPDVAVKMGILKEKAISTKTWNAVSQSILKNVKRFSVIGRDMERIILAKAKDLQEKSSLIYNWSDALHVKPIVNAENIFLQQHPALRDKILFVYSGNMGRTHNMEDILAFAKEFDNEQNCIFLFIGGGAKYKMVKEETAKRNNIMAMPYLPFELLPHVLNAAAYCLVCLDESFTGYSVPSKTYGIMAAGKPLIGFLSANSEIGMTIIENNCGFVAEKNCLFSNLKKNALNAIQDGRHATMCNNSLEAFKKNFTLEVAAEKYYKAFKNTFA